MCGGRSPVSDASSRALGMRAAGTCYKLRECRIKAEAKALERGAHHAGSQLSLLLANSRAEEIKGRGVISLSERVNVLC